jgi:hypothetical protein
MPEARTDSTMCGRCRKKFQENDRVVQAFIVDRVGSHPNNLAAMGAWLHEEFELVHVDCTDPTLVRGMAT